MASPAWKVVEGREEEAGVDVGDPSQITERAQVPGRGCHGPRFPTGDGGLRDLEPTRQFDLGKMNLSAKYLEPGIVKEHNREKGSACFLQTKPSNST